MQSLMIRLLFAMVPKSRLRRRARKLFVLCAIVSCLGFMVGGLPASGDAMSDQLTIREVDTTQFPDVKLTVLPPASLTNTGDLRISENGKPVGSIAAKTIDSTDAKLVTMIVLDTSSDTFNQDALSKMRNGVIEFINAMPANEQIGIVATSGSGRTIARPSADKAALIASIERLNSSDKNALWGSVDLASGILAETDHSQANMVVITNSPDNGSLKGTLENAKSRIVQAGTGFYPVGVQTNRTLPTETLTSLAADTGARYYGTNDVATATQVLSGVRKAIRGQVVLTYTSTTKAKSLGLVVSAGAENASAQIGRGTRAVGSAVSPELTTNGKANLLASPLGLLAIVVAAFLCIALLVLAIAEVFGSERNQLRRALSPYSDEPGEQRDFSKLADSELVKRAVAATARAAERRGLLQAVEARLQQADLPLKPAEALFGTAVGAIIAIIIGFILMKFIGMFIAAILFAFLPFAAVNFMAARRRRKFTSQLPDTLQLLAGSLRAGYSFVQGMDAVAKQTESPMGDELTRAISEARLGRPLEESLEDVSQRMGSPDFEWAVMAIRIQREVGGNLAELLMTVSETMIARERLRREVLALTAEGRISAIILCILPFAIGAVIMVMNPVYMQPMLSNLLGQIAIAVAVMMIIVGYVIMNKLIKIEA